MSEVKAHAQDYTVGQWQTEIWSLGILAPKPTFLTPRAHCLPALQVLCFASPAFKCVEELFSRKQEWRLEWGGEMPTFIPPPLVLVFPEADRDIPGNTFENHLFTFFSVTFYFEIIVDLYAVVRNNTEKMCILYLVFPSGNILQICTTISQLGS